MTSEEHKALPAREVLDDKGCVWESVLASKGWNDLSGDDRQGVIQGCFELKDGGKVFDIWWPAIDTLTKNVFVNEVLIL